MAYETKQPDTLQHRDSKRAEMVTQTLFSISNAVSTASDLKELYQSIHLILGRILDLTNFFIAIYNKKTGRISFPYFADQFDSADTYTDQFTEESSLTGSTIRGGKPVYLDQTELQKRSSQNRIIGTTPTVWIGIPLLIQGEVIGIMATQSYDQNHNFDREDLDLLVSVSDQVALAIERKRNEQALKASEERFRLAMEATHDGLWDWDLAEDNVYYSPGYFTMLGYSPDHDDHTLDFWKKHIHPDDREKVFKANKDCIENRTESFQLQARMTTREGGYKWILVRGMSVSRQSDGTAVRMIGTHTDITRQMETESRLRASEEMYRSMMESMIDPVYICSQDLRIEYMNPAMVRRIGRDATGEKCHSALHDMDRRCDWCKFTATPEAYYETDIISPKDHRSYHVSSSPITHQDGTVSKLTVFRDTTEMKRIETQLQQAQKMESIGSLAGGIAHDFNNILTPVIGISEMFMLEFPPGTIEHENAAEILKAGNRGRNLVQQILAFSRQSDYQKSPVRIQSILKEVLNLCRSSIPSSIEISCDIHKDAQLIEADSTRIHQVAMNLITNAYHAVDQSGGKIVITLSNVELTPNDNGGMPLAPGNYVKLTVTDNGHGMSQEIVERIFDPYFTTKPKGKGTGLGLATVYGVVKECEGEIRVNSRQGEGTTFEVFFPAMQPDTPAPEVEHRHGYRGGTESILVVDDEDAIVLLLKRMLETLGYKVTERRSSADALEAFLANPDKFDAVISDMTMPGMTGDQLTAELLAIRPELPVIICSGFSEKINRDNAKALGVKAYLMKPIIMSDMAETLRSVLDGEPLQ